MNNVNRIWCKSRFFDLKYLSNYLKIEWQLISAAMIPLTICIGFKNFFPIFCNAGSSTYWSKWLPLSSIFSFMAAGNIITAIIWNQKRLLLLLPADFEEKRRSGERRGVRGRGLGGLVFGGVNTTECWLYILGYVTLIRAVRRCAGRQASADWPHWAVAKRHPKRHPAAGPRQFSLPLQRSTLHFSPWLSQKYPLLHPGILKFAHCSSAIFIVALIYIDRLQEAVEGFVLNQYCVHR